MNRGCLHRSGNPRPHCVRRVSFFRILPLDTDFLAESVFAISASEDAHRMHRPDAGVLLELQSSQWTVRRPNFRIALFHAIESLLADARRWLEAFDRHRVGAVV